MRVVCLLNLESIASNRLSTWCVLEKKEELVKAILRIGEPLISIRGITSLTALAFLDPSKIEGDQ
jgi:hypothetical protein